jgi:hypothetical protein
MDGVREVCLCRSRCREQIARRLSTARRSVALPAYPCGGDPVLDYQWTLIRFILLYLLPLRGSDVLPHIHQPCVFSKG